MPHTKNIYLIRHAKASWDEPQASDFERSLTSIGEEDAHIMGKRLKEMGITADFALSSPAKRAIDTAQIIVEELNLNPEKIALETLIYSGSMEELVAIIKQLDRNCKNVLFFGHNPSLTWLAHYFCEDAKMNIPTCGIVGIKFTIRDWTELTNAEGKLSFFIHPQHE